ncbi:MAG: EamA family transporter [Acidimicrobiia bacterium]
MAVLLALASAMVYGVADYCGGRATRHASAFAVTAFGQAVSLVLLLAVLPVLGDPSPPLADWAWGAGGGVAGAIGLLAFYHALSRGSMSVIAPTTAVVSVSIPVAVGLLLGERPGATALVGIGVAMLAIVLVSGAFRPSASPTPARIAALAVFGGVGFGLIFVFFERTSEASGLWPLVAARFASVPLVLTAASALRQPLGVARVWGIALACGVLDMSANVLYLLATREGLLTIVSVITALYPVSTVALAFGLDRERVSRSQAAGMAMALAALAMVSLG